MLYVFVGYFTNLFDDFVLLFAKEVVRVAIVHSVECFVEEVTHLLSHFLIAFLFLAAFN